MKTAREILESQDKHEIGAYFVALDEIGQTGVLAKMLLRAQRYGEAEYRAAQHPDASPYEDYLRLMHSRNDYSVRELILHCTQTEPWLKGVRIQRYKYGIRITLHKQPALRFRHIDNRWRGDASNAEIICAHCDRLIRENYDDAKSTGKLFSWPTAV